MIDNKYQRRIDGLVELANLAVREDTVKKTGFEVLKKCHEKGTVSGNGAYAFMSELMRKCKKHQVKDIIWLFHECMPNMYPLAMESMLKERIYMHSRCFQSKALNHCIHSLMNKWKKQGKIRKKFKPLKNT